MTKKAKHRKSYDHVKSGEWVKPHMTGYKMACCDCGLVHTINFRVTKKGRVLFQAFRNNRSTAAVRRERKKRENNGRI